MTDQPDSVEAERPPEQEHPTEHTDEPRAEQTADQQKESRPQRPPTGWSDLDAYCEQLRAEHAAWAERIDALDAQLLALRATLAGIGEQYRALGIEDDLALINERILGGIGMAQSLRIGHDLERYTALLWPASSDPRPSLAKSDGDAEYRVEVWMHLGPDGKGRIRIEGEKRLEATLPTSRDRVRSVLMRAIQAPKLVGRSESTSNEAASQPPSEHPKEEPVESASPRPSDPETQPPPEEQVIPLGPAEESNPGSSEPKEES